MIVKNVKEAGGKKITDDYIVFNPNQIKSVNNSGAWSSSPSLSDAGWTPEPYIGSLYEGLNPFQAKSLKGDFNKNLSQLYDEYLRNCYL